MTKPDKNTFKNVIFCAYQRAFQTFYSFLMKMAFAQTLYKIFQALKNS